MKKLNVVTIVICLFFVTGLYAQDGQRSYVKVTPAGVETITEALELSSCGQSSPAPKNTPPGLRWNRADGGLAWIGNCVSVGNRGTQSVAVFELNNESVELYSTFDANPATPIWLDSTLLGTSTGYKCDSAQTADRHVVMYHVDSPDIYNRIPVVHGYTSSSPAPDWTWQYPTTVNYGSNIAIDRDATVVAVAVYNNNTGMLDLFFLDPATGAVMDTYSQALGGLRGWDLSADGTTLYFHDNSTVYIFDIATKTVVFTTATSGSFDSHCISGDGTKFAFGGFGFARVWEYVGGSWSSHNFSTGSGNYVSTMDFSDDGSTLGFGVFTYTTGAKSEFYVADIPTKTVTDHITNISNGAYQDVPKSCSISHDGTYCALGRWGDQMNANPEVQIIEKGRGIVGTIDMRGSAYTVDISWDGQVTVSTGKAIHANVNGNGGDVYCYDLGNEDMNLIGAPRINSNITIDVYTNPNWLYALLLGSADDPSGVAVYPFGTLYLDPTPPNLFMLLPVLNAGPTGQGSLPIFIPNDPMLVGSTPFTQALFSSGGSAFQLSNDYLTVTILP
ncbi:MAG: WD40 repeat domain-containing protein [Planctomycetota bacterium]